MTPKGQSHAPRTELLEGVHYYLEAGRWVFTERFLLERGYCCSSGCRHCPYPGERECDTTSRFKEIDIGAEKIDN
jgi:hypothetical protein